MKVRSLGGGEGSEMVREGVWVMGAADAVVDGNQKLRSESEPKGTGGSGVVRVVEPMGEEFFNPSEGLEYDGTLGGFGEVVKLERVGNGDGVGVGGVFNGRIDQFTERNGDGLGWDSWDVGIHG